ncbi:MAG: cytochrome D1 domain-containing protein [Gemmatimonadota bacterium]
MQLTENPERIMHFRRSTHRPSVAALARLLLPAALFLPAAAIAQAPKEYLYVGNSLSGDVSVIEIPAHKVVGTIPAALVGEHPDDIISNRDGTILFVSRLDAEDVIAINTETEQILWKLPVGGVPNHLTLSADEQFLFVPLFDKGLLVVVDLKTREIVARPTVGMGAHGTVLSADGKSVYVGSIGGNQLAVVDAGGTHEVKKIIPLSEGVRPFQISPDQRYAYVQLSKLHGFVVVDLATDKVVKTIELPTFGKPLPAPSAKGSLFVMNHGLGLSPDQKYLVANASLSGFVAIYSHPGLELLGTVTVGHQPNWVAFSKDSKYAYVSNRLDDTISAIQLANHKEVARIKVGHYPQRMTVAVTKRRGGSSATGSREE